MEKTQKTLISKVRGEPARPQQETERSLHLSSWFCHLPCPVKKQDVIVDLAAAGGAIMGPLPRVGGCLSPPLGDEVTAGAPQASPFPVEILAPLGTQMYSSPSR